MPTYVIGHKNPDTDSICSAIGYADFLRRTQMPQAEAARCGEPNARTLYALEQAGLDSPKLVMDVRPTAGQICHREVVSAGEEESLLQAFDRMRLHGLRSMPVMRNSGEVVGLLSFQMTLNLLLPGTRTGNEARAITTTLEHICNAFHGRFQHVVDEKKKQTLLMSVGAMSAKSFEERLREHPPEQVLLVVGNRPTVQKPAVEYGVRCLVVTGGFELDAELLELAKARGVSVILSPLDTASSTLLIKCAQGVMDAVSVEYARFSENTLVAEVREKVQMLHQDLFPVMDDKGRMSGVFSKSDLVNPPRTRLILVDHNEFSQAVTGVEDAEILEVIDHHRLGGDLVTREPIRYINDTVGSTSTLVARLFRQNGLAPESAIALALSAGIISDTLNLTSPTTTSVDKDMLDWLGGLAKTDLKKFSEGFFTAGSPLQILTPQEVANGDCKEYAENGWRIAVSQVEELGHQRFWQRKDELKYAMRQMLLDKRLDLACLLITDITVHDSLLLVVGDSQLKSRIEYPQLDADLFELKGVVSRKKQLLPALIRILSHTAKKAE
ncbi:MAG: putative manganese-dependent inorganic diphosphatase [Methylacidiphilales bacterium]|nr:putative manganese-dependent inorganic diphosphatase [Candidatus Methylacidiphilales bacterium]